MSKTENGWKWVVVRSAKEEAALEAKREAGLAACDPAETLAARVDDMCAVAEEGRWWEELKGDPKRLGEVSQAAFLLKARTLGLSVAIPWGDSDQNDFIVWARQGGEMLRVQVKGTGRLYRRGYEVQPVRSTRGQGKKRYTKKEIDVLVAHVQPVDAWYVVPIEEVGRARSLRLYPGIESRKPRWEQWRDRWDVLGRR